jgi:pyridoxal phosphate enzyme (YggS family)
MPVSPGELAGRITAVQARIAAAATRAGRDPASVTLVAVSKTQPAPSVVAAYHSGLRHFGENRVEEATPKAQTVAALLGPDAPVSWHMVGHVQSRKAEGVLPWAGMLHSVESEKLAARLSRACAAAGVTLPVLIEVNVAGEASKYGVTRTELPVLAAQVVALPGLRLEGLMTIAPIAANPETVRPVFLALRALRDDLRRAQPGLPLPHLSMGMTDDFEVAIEEGATLVRIGRALFGERMAT